ncbi:MAG: choice-of-anchor Q domain-containing protein, partial [Planctomycetota bacterium]
LLFGSAAINAGNKQAATAAGLTTDQRGTGFARIVDGAIDIGAVEFQTPFFLVDTSSDLDDGDYSPGNLSLREAIQLANASSTTNTIVFDAVLSGQTILLSTEILISDDLTMIGLGADQLTLDGAHNSRIFNIDDGSSVTEISVSISGLTLTNGYEENGGAILNRENLTLADSHLTGNTASLDGGGIFNSNSTLTISNSTFTQNHSDHDGGAIKNNTGGSLTINSSTFHQNSSDNNGGTLANSAAMYVHNSTLSGNSTLHLGAGIYSGSTATLEVLNSTIVLNESTSDVSEGGAVYGSDTNPFEIKNSIIAGNTAAGSPQVAGVYNSSSSIVQDSIAGLIDPVLKVNGGPTQTHALLSGSAAINAGDNGIAESAGLLTDQRGVGYPRMFDGTVDMGAVEFRESGFIVDNISDLDDGDYSAGNLSLREAIQLANASSTADTIHFDGSLAGQTIFLSSELSITADLTIIGLGADQLTLDAVNNSRIFNIDNGDIATTIRVEIDGLKLANGSTNSTGGAILSYEDLAVKNSILTGNTARLGGGGIFSSLASLTIENSLVSENASLFQGGGGVMYLRSGGTGLTISESTFALNTTDGDGAAIYFFAGDASVLNSTFNENTADSSGGAIQNNYSGSMTVDSSTFYKNRANDQGGALANLNELFLTNSTLSENSADFIGGGIYTYRNTTLEIVNSTIVKNQATSSVSRGGGIFSPSPNLIKLANSIIAGNTAVNFSQIDGSYTENSCIISDSISGLIDPVLRDNGGDTKTHALLPGSAAQNAGDNTAATDAGLSTDQRGTGFPRILNSTVDIGAFEGSSDIFTVDTISDLDDGDYSVGNFSLREAIKLANAASTTDTIFFDAALAGQTIVLESELSITDDVTINGLGADQLTISGNNNSRIFNITSTDITVEITGLTLTKGSAIQGGAIYNRATLIFKDSILTENAATQYGAGIYSTQGNVTVSGSMFSRNAAILGGGIYTSGNAVRGSLSVLDSTFSENTQVESGGGIYNDGGSLSIEASFFTGNVVIGESANGLGGGIYSAGGSLTIAETEFSDNVASRSGGGIYSGINEFLTISGSTFAGNQSRTGGGIHNLRTTLTILDSRFTENQALVTPGLESLSAVGGALFNAYAVATAAGEMNTLIANTVFTGNYADHSGAAIYQSFGFITISNSLITDNLVGQNGSGIYNLSGQLTVYQSTISKNNALGNGGGIFNYGTLLLSESTVAENVATYTGGGIYISPDGATTIYNSTLSGNQSGFYGGAIYADTDQPLSIVNTTITGNTTHYGGGGMRASYVTPTIINSIIAGNSAQSASQLYSGYTNINSIIQDSIAGLLDPVLRDNGGPTKTHALLPGSAAIDAGDNTAVIDAEIEFDQRGTGFSRIVNETVDIGAFEVQSPFAQVELRIVDTKTSTQSNGESTSLPENLGWLDEWSGYWLEIWISTPTTTDLGVLSAAMNVSYNTAITTATAIEFGAAFTVNQTGTINDQTGTIENLSAESSLTDVGDDQRVLFARIRFESTADDGVDLDLDGQSLNQQSPEFVINHPEILFTGDAASEEVHGAAPTTQIWANPFDLNDDDVINFRDLSLFVSVYYSIPSESEAVYSWFADLNQNDRVEFRDLILFVSNYGKRKADHSTINYPQNFPEAWNQLLTVETPLPPQANAQPVTQAAAETVLESVVEQVSPQLTPDQSEKLAQIHIEVVDLAGDTLGRAAAGTIYIDVNAAGRGWFVDSTPADHSEFTVSSTLTLIAFPDSEAAGRVDLWTVILHELGHLLGHAHETDGVMQDSLAPGVRKLPDWEVDSDLFFSGLSDDASLIVF